MYLSNFYISQANVSILQNRIFGFNLILVIKNDKEENAF